MNRKYFWAFLIFTATCGLRFIFIFESNSIPAIATPVPGMDIDLYWQAARLLGQGSCSDSPCFELMMCSSPLYPHWLAFWQKVLGPSMFLHRLFSAFLVSASAVCIFHLIQKMTRQLWIAIVSGLAWATWPSLIFFDSMLYKSSLGILALTCLLVVVCSKKTSTHLFSFVLKGILISLLLGALFQLQSATFLVIIPVVLYVSIDTGLDYRKKAVLTVTIIGGFLLYLFIFHVRNHETEAPYPRYLPQKGVHLNIGFNEKADGTYVRLKGIQPWPYGHNFQARMRAEVGLGRKLTPAEADHHYINQALRYIRENPLDAIALSLSKAGLFLNNYEIKGVDDLYYLKTKSRILSSTPLGLGILVMLSGTGIYFLIATRQYPMLVLIVSLLLVVLASNMMIFVTWRYRIFNIVPLFLLASYGLLSIQHFIRRLLDARASLRSRMIRFTTAVLIPMFLCGTLTYYPLLGEKRGQFHRQAVNNENLSLRAIKRFKRLETREKYSSEHPKAMISKALVLKKLHRHSEAFRLLDAIHKKKYFDAKAAYHYIFYLLWLGEYDSAKNVIEDIKDTDPGVVLKIESMLIRTEREAYMAFVKPLIR